MFFPLALQKNVYMHHSILALVMFWRMRYLVSKSAPSFYDFLLDNVGDVHPSAVKFLSNIVDALPRLWL